MDCSSSGKSSLINKLKKLPPINCYAKQWWMTWRHN